jgi:predicted AAA+ superfamily ATPase
LTKKVSESLAGRADIVQRKGLSFAEIETALPDTGDTAHFASFG